MGRPTLNCMCSMQVGEIGVILNVQKKIIIIIIMKAFIMRRVSG